jgi:hypothetical protein
MPTDFIVLCGRDDANRLMADAIWHLLLKKIIISLSDEPSISDLREMYPLSKVCRAKLCVDAELDKTLILLSHDSSFSGRDLVSLKEAFAGVWDVLLVDERELELMSEFIDLSALIVSETVAAIQTAAGREREKVLLGFALDWLLFGLGSAAINGSAQPSRPFELNPENRERIHKAVKDVFTAQTAKRGGSV